MPGSSTAIQVGVSPAPDDDIGPGWVCLERSSSPYAYVTHSMFMPYSGVRFDNLPVTTWSKVVVMYWRGDRVYDWIVGY